LSFQSFTFAAFLAAAVGGFYAVPKKGRLAVLLISHDLDYVRKYADHVVLIDGKVLTQGTPKEVYDSDAFKQVFTDMEVRG